MKETHIELAETPEQLDRVIGYVIGHDTLELMLCVRLSRLKIMEAAALEAFIDNRFGPEVEQIRLELRYLRDNGRFFFASKGN